MGQKNSKRVAEHGARLDALEVGRKVTTDGFNAVWAEIDRVNGRIGDIGDIGDDIRTQNAVIERVETAARFEKRDLDFLIKEVLPGIIDSVLKHVENTEQRFTEQAGLITAQGHVIDDLTGRVDFLQRQQNRLHKSWCGFDLDHDGDCVRGDEVGYPVESDEAQDYTAKEGAVNEQTYDSLVEENADLRTENDLLRRQAKAYWTEGPGSEPIPSTTGWVPTPITPPPFTKDTNVKKPILDRVSISVGPVTGAWDDHFDHTLLPTVMAEILERDPNPDKDILEWTAVAQGIKVTVATLTGDVLTKADLHDALWAAYAGGQR